MHMQEADRCSYSLPSDLLHQTKARHAGDNGFAQLGCWAMACPVHMRWWSERGCQGRGSYKVTGTQCHL